MNEADALRVLLLRELESAEPQDAALWSAADRDWATRIAVDAVGRDAGALRFLIERANQALQRCASRLPELQAWLGQRGWRAAWVAWALFGALIVGLGIDSLGSRRHINLLAPPFWGVMAWNLVVYLLLIVRALWKQAAHSGTLIGAVQAALTRAPAAAGKTALLGAFVPVWVRTCLPQNMARAAMLLHALAAALALGLIAGLYLRGLVFDYRAGWQSTFLDPQSVHAVLSIVLAPAVQLTGIGLPDAAALGALRLGVTSGEASAASWIHLLAASLALLVVLPRLLLSLAYAWRARRLAAHVELPLHEPYFQRLLREQRGEVAQVHVLPYAKQPDAHAVEALRALLAQALGKDVQVRVGEGIDFGAEDDATPAHLAPQGTTHALLWFDMTATPEAEHHGRIAAALAGATAGGALALLLVDETAFAQRFGGMVQRSVERRAAWQGFADAAALPMLLVSLDPAHAQQGAASALHAALATATRRRASRADE